MARKRSGDKPKRNDAAVKIDKGLADKVKLVADRRGITMAEYLTDLLRSPVERDYAKAVREMANELD